MRTASFKTRNDLTVEIFLDRRADSLEFWLVGPHNGARTVLNHYLTHDELDAALRYSKATLLNWSAAKPADLPEAKSAAALDDEKTIAAGTFWDAADLSEHFAGLATLDPVPETWRTAFSCLPGTWSDGISTLDFGADASFSSSVAPASASPFLRAVAKSQPDQWHFSGAWQLRLFNTRTRHAERILVHELSPTALHLAGAGNCIAFILKRQGSPQ
jgi:hypothetical protein